VIHNLEEFCDFIYETLKEYWFVKRKPKIRKNTVKSYAEATQIFFYLEDEEGTKEILHHIQSCSGPAPMKHFCIHETFALTGQIVAARWQPMDGHLGVEIVLEMELGHWEPVV